MQRDGGTALKIPDSSFERIAQDGGAEFGARFKTWATIDAPPDIFFSAYAWISQHEHPIEGDLHDDDVNIQHESTSARFLIGNLVDDDKVHALAQLFMELKFGVVVCEFVRGDRPTYKFRRYDSSCIVHANTIACVYAFVPPDLHALSIHVTGTSGESTHTFRVFHDPETKEFNPDCYDDREPANDPLDTTAYGDIWELFKTLFLKKELPAVGRVTSVRFEFTDDVGQKFSTRKRNLQHYQTCNGGYVGLECRAVNDIIIFGIVYTAASYCKTDESVYHLDRSDGSTASRFLHFWTNFARMPENITVTVGEDIYSYLPCGEMLDF